MALTIIESVQSRKQKESRREGLLETTLETIWTIQGSDDPGSAAVKALGPQPLEVYGDGSLNLVVISRDWEVIPLGSSDGAIRLTATYGPPERASDPNDQSAEEPEYELDMMAETEHVEKALEQSHYPSTENDCGLVIGVNGDKVDGVDIYVPKGTYRQTKFVNRLSAAYINAIKAARAHVNGATWRGWEANTVLFLGAKASRRGRHGIWKLQFEFALSDNTNQSIVTGPPETPVTQPPFVKPGWHYMWMSRAENTDAGGTKVQSWIRGAHVARVYPTADFATLGLGTAAL
jgi:hypothetical protein